MTYQELDAKLQGRCKYHRKLSRNTTAHRDYSGLSKIIYIQYHQTDILAFHPNGNVSMDIGHWWTITTKQRLNQFLPRGYAIYSYQRTGQWFLFAPRHDVNNGGWPMRAIAAFANGMTIHADGEISGAISYAEWEEERLQRVHIARSEAAKRAATTRKFAKETWKLLGGDAYYA